MKSEVYLIENRIKFINSLCEGMAVNTPKGKATVTSIIEEIHCTVNVILENGVKTYFGLEDIWEI
jgi:hypothetical protein